MNTIPLLATGDVGYSFVYVQLLLVDKKSVLTNGLAERSHMRNLNLDL